MRFSIIIPIYNVEKYIEECINSVIYQDFIHDEFEIILIDDGSTDNSSIIAKKLASAHSSIKYFKQPNGGLSSARNLGILKSLGEYLIFLDSDDFWVGKKHLSHLSQIIDKTKAEIIFYGFTSYFENEKKKQTPFPFYTPEKISGIFNNDFDYLVNCHIFKPTACDKVILRKTVIENKLFFPEG
ncbi:MAG TPA: glycosyltransferase family 2 protein, partial [Petrimonas sp.]|nr:glycosyltransferase family 2 protein [Petrimonas sp.]